MAFANERIDTPEKRAEFDALRLISPATGRPPEQRVWAVDRERNMYFVSLGGGFGDIPELFALVARGQQIIVAGTQEVTGTFADRNLQIEWTISEVRFPKALAVDIELYLQWLREALIAHGWHFDDSAVKRVQVTLPAPSVG